MHASAAIPALPTDAPYRARLGGAAAVSLAVHALILSLQFGVPGIGLPGLELPWRERRAQTVDLNVVLAPSPAVSIEEVAPAAPNPASGNASSPGLRIVPLPPAPAPKVRRKSGATKTVPAQPPRARVKRETPVVALNDARDSEFDMPAPAVDEIQPLPEAVPEAPAIQTPVPEPADDLAARERQAEEDRAVRERLAQEENALRHELALEAERAEEEKRRDAAARLAQEMDERRKAEEAARQAASALQQQQEETTRRALELEEKQREQAQRLQAEREQREAMELQARKQAEAAEAARQQAAVRERQADELVARRKAEADAASAQKREREPELALGDSPVPGARIDALPRGIGGGLAGRALEQARRGDALRNDVPAAHAADSNPGQPRRRSILGSKDVDVGVMMYVESWRLKIERNGSIMYPRAAAELSHRDPVVTVAVRSDGSVEGVVLNQSSGRPELDEAVHRIVRVNARYAAFPPELARRFDVIEIRKVWNFEDRLRILEEVR